MKQGKIQKRTMLIITLVALSILLAIMLGVLLFLNSGGGSDKNHGKDPENNTTAQEQTGNLGQTEPLQNAGASGNTGQSIYGNGEIQTPYLTLYYDDGFSDHLVIEKNESTPFTLKFYVQLEGKPIQHIFEISMGEGSGGNLGMMQTDQGSIPVNLTMYDFDPDDSWKKGEIDTVFATQEMANDLIDQLPLVKTQGSK